MAVLFWRWFIELEILAGRLSAPGFFDDPDTADDLLETEWMPPPRQWIDPAKEAAAEKMRIDYRLASRGQLLNRQGFDWRENFQQIAQEQQFAVELDLTLPENQPGPGGRPAVSPSEPKVREGGGAKGG